ncbi:hypothetical protein VSVS12_02726 [Vibrio scophthalmi]|uniref:hypothetical protein n=1 Tax=Vibrio scophthalmi TaxID=45658 RepID=UPI0008096BEF|nr:hypothetical protein [Vibrio scophthalmi]ANS86475.1 hypothetical protein VSVS12_02726 [Vibrio scophthalmi]
MKKILLVSVLILNGCASQQNFNENNFSEKSNEILTNKINEMVSKNEDYQEIDLKLIEVIDEKNFEDVDIEFNFTSEATLKDLIDVFEFYNINTITSNSIDVSQKININSFNGKLSDLLNATSENTNLTFIQKDNFLNIQELKNYKIKVVQDKDIIDSVRLELEKLENSIKELIVSETAGIFSFKSDYKTFKKIKNLINEINDNTSLINIDLSIINVELKENQGNGFDWETLNVVANINPTELIEKGFSLVGGDKLNIQSTKFNMSVVMNILNTYGTSETLQNTSIKTLSGKEATFKTTEKTPYIDKVEVSNNGEFTETGFTTKETETGLEVKVLPYFDNYSKMVNININVLNSSLKGFLSIIKNDIEIQQPQTEQQDFNSVIRLKTGETSVIGGIVYYSEKKTGNHILNEITQSNKTEVTKNALFLIIKPSVKTYIHNNKEKK